MWARLSSEFLVLLGALGSSGGDGEYPVCTIVFGSELSRWPEIKLFFKQGERVWKVMLFLVRQYVSWAVYMPCWCMPKRIILRNQVRKVVSLFFITRDEFFLVNENNSIFLSWKIHYLGYIILVFSSNCVRYRVSSKTVHQYQINFLARYWT